MYIFHRLLLVLSVLAGFSATNVDARSARKPGQARAQVLAQQSAHNVASNAGTKKKAPKKLLGANSEWADFYNWRKKNDLTVGKVVGVATAVADTINWGLWAGSDDNFFLNNPVTRCFGYAAPLGDPKDKYIPIDSIKSGYEHYYGFWPQVGTGAVDSLAAGRRISDITDESADAVTRKYAIKALATTIAGVSGVGPGCMSLINSVDNMLYWSNGFEFGGRAYGSVLECVSDYTILPVVYRVTSQLKHARNASLWNAGNKKKWLSGDPKQIKKMSGYQNKYCYTCGKVMSRLDKTWKDPNISQQVKNKELETAHRNGCCINVLVNSSTNELSFKGNLYTSYFR